MALETIELRVHHAFACLPHYTGQRGLAERGEGFILNFNGKIDLLNQGAPIRLVDRWDSVCAECFGKNNLCLEYRMQELDRRTLLIVNKYLSQFGYNPLKMNETYNLKINLTRLLRQGFKAGHLRDVCTSIDCKWMDGCIETARSNFVPALFHSGEGFRP
jgi:hypothetical protein